MSDRCRSCKAEVMWAVGAFTGKPAPLDPEPNEKGTVYIMESGQGKGKALTLSGPILGAAREKGLPLHTNHFATCPHSESHRRPA